MCEEVCEIVARLHITVMPHYHFKLQNSGNMEAKKLKGNLHAFQVEGYFEQLKHPFNAIFNRTKHILPLVYFPSKIDNTNSIQLL